VWLLHRDDRTRANIHTSTDISDGSRVTRVCDARCPAAESRGGPFGMIVLMEFHGRDGVRLACREVGEGRPLVLFHGFMGRAAHWIET
jgi:hypothetical protein